jgi:peptidoglycan biosynthesis protein MviN/MurJ (putative lipid II flippase)
MLLGLFLLLVPRLGLPGAAYAALMTSILSTPIYLWQVRRTVGILASEFLRAVMRPIGAAIAMALVVRSVLPEWTEQMASLTALAWLVAGIVIGIMTYVCALLLLWLAAGRPDGAERVVLAQIRQRLQKGGATGQPART